MDLNRQLTERVKELQCLHDVSSLLAGSDRSLDAVLQDVVERLPAGWLDPERMAARIVIDEREWSSPGFRSSPWSQRVPIGSEPERGSVEVVHVEEPRDPRTPFLPEEDELIRGIAERVSESLRRREAEEAIERSEVRFRTLIENSSDVISIVDREGCVIYASPSFERIVGWPREEMIGAGLLDLVHPDDRDLVKREIESLVENPNRIGVVRYRARHRDGSWRVHESRGSSRLEDPDIAGLVVNTRDVTEQWELERRLQHAHAMDAVGRLAGGIAHDFNNLLTVIRGGAAALWQELPDSAAAREDLEGIERAADRAASLTRQLLVFGRRQVLHPTYLDPNEVVRGMEDLLRRLIGEDVRIDLHLSADIGLVRVDPGQLEQVVLNLAVNARDSMPEGGRLTIETRRRVVDQEDGLDPDLEPGDHVLLSVSDTGGGIPHEVRDRVFEPFFTTKQGGSGLGLATTHGIVKQSGGHVRFRDREGGGTTFEVLLPLAERATGSPGPSRPAATPRPERPESGTILVAEDEPMILQLCARVLEKAGYTVLTADSGAEALRLAERHASSIDLLLSDVVMPEMGGRELARRLRASHPGIRVVFMSGYMPEDERSDGEQDATVLSKPFVPKQLLEVAAAALATRERGREP